MPRALAMPDGTRVCGLEIRGPATGLERSLRPFCSRTCNRRDAHTLEPIVVRPLGTSTSCVVVNSQFFARGDRARCDEMQRPSNQAVP